MNEGAREVEKGNEKYNAPHEDGSGTTGADLVRARSWMAANRVGSLPTGPVLRTRLAPPEPDARYARAARSKGEMRCSTAGPGPFRFERAERPNPSTVTAEDLRPRRYPNISLTDLPRPPPTPSFAAPLIEGTRRLRSPLPPICLTSGLWNFGALPLASRRRPEGPGDHPLAGPLRELSEPLLEQPDGGP
jgi:hypothetical protein